MDKRMDVSKWQAARRQFQYTPVMQFFARFINVALLDCNCELAIAPLSRGVLVALAHPGAQPSDRPTDDALLARDWIARSADPTDRHTRSFLSFPECCAQLGAQAEASRLSLLVAVDAAGDYDSPEAWARLEDLSAREPQDDVEPLFDAPRVVPALDQMALF